jgi:DNA-binding beta-propeller fold protein YncE
MRWIALPLLLVPAVVHGPRTLAAQAPEGLAGTLVVLNKRGDDASFVDLASGDIVATAPTGVGPHELLILGDGRTAVGTDYEGEVGSLTLLDVVSGTRTRTIDLSPYRRPHGIDVLPGDSVVAVTVEQDRAVLLVRLRDGAILQAIDTRAEGSHMVAIPGDGRTLWTGDIGSNTVSQFDVETGARLQVLEAPAQPEAINVTEDGRRLFAGSNATGAVSVFDTGTGGRTTVAEGFGWPYRMFLTPDAGQLIVPDMRREVLRFFDGTSYEELGQIEFTEQGPQGLTLHPDGRHLFLSLSGADRIAVVDIVERRVVGHLPAGASPDGIGYSPRTVSR